MWSMAVARTRRLEIDWSAIRAEFDGIRAAIIPFRVASEQDIERCKLSDMTHGLIASKLVEDWRRNDCVVILDKEKRERLTDLAYMLGFSDDDNFTDDKYKNEGRPNWRQLDELLSQHTVNTEFMHLWSLLNFYFGVYVELYLGNEAIYKREFHQCMMSIGDATQIQRHWYAHWMHETVQRKSRDIGDARSELIAVIENIKAGELKPWGPYQVEWYECMLEKRKGFGGRPDQYSGDLKTSYTKISLAEISRMVQDPLVPRRVLPPLSADRFERA
ncbi:hypothetical protein ADL19_23950 [Streptomyces purpurogeneiscleroticus]|nr:hypothetical protein ADL19_23950 [Streptomyces purpurogeneiscleroticus]